MKFLRSSFLLLIFVPFVGFCNYDHLLTNGVGQVRVYRYTSASASAVSFTSCTCSDSSDLLVVYQNHPFGLRVNSDSDDIRSPAVDVVPNRTWSIDRQVQCYTNEFSSSYFSPRDFSAIHRLYFLAASLFYSGYRGSGITVLGGSSIVYFNFDYRSAIADILCSTNTVYRSLLLSHLSSIQQSVLNIDSGVSDLVPSLGRIEEINSGISSTLSPISENVSSINSYSSEINSTLHSTHNIITNIDGVVSSIPSYLLSNSNSLDRLHNDNALANLDVFLGDDTSAWVGFCNWSYDQELLSSSERDYFISEFQQTDSSVPLSRSYSIPASHRRFLAKSSLQGRVVAVNKLRGVYQSMGYTPSGSRPWSQEAISAIGSALNQSTVGELNYLTGQVEDWRDNLRQQLQDWKTSDERGILNVKKSIDDNFSYHPNPAFTNTLPFTTFVTNFVTIPFTNALDSQTQQLSTNIISASSNVVDAVDRVKDTLSDGIDVRIQYPLEGDPDHVNVHDQALENALEELRDIQSAMLNQLEIMVGSGSSDFDLTEWYQRWDEWAPGVHTNIQAILDVLLNFTNSVQRDHVLFHDYSNYVHSASFNDLFTTLENDYPVCYSNLVKFGLSSSEDGGRWWNVLASSVSYDTAMLSYVFSDMLELDRIARDSLQKSPFDFLRSTLSDMPSKSQIEDYVSQASNATFQVIGSLASLSNSLNSVSNSYSSVFNPFRGHFDSPGTSLTFFKLYDGRDGQYVTIPVSDQADAWRYIRLGVSFGLVAVNILLFPKYLLMLFTLFVKAFRIGIKFFPDDR